jgi:hypothetical protein
VSSLTGNSGTPTETQASGFSNISLVRPLTFDPTALDYSIVSSNAAVTYNPSWSASSSLGQLVIPFVGSDFDMCSRGMFT